MNRALALLAVLALASVLVVAPPQPPAAEAISVSYNRTDPRIHSATTHPYDTYFVRLTRNETNGAHDSKWYLAGLMTGACTKLKPWQLTATCVSVAAIQSVRLARPLERASRANGCLQIQFGPGKTRVTGNPTVTTRTLPARNPDCKAR